MGTTSSHVKEDPAKLMWEKGLIGEWYISGNKMLRFVDYINWTGIYECATPISLPCTYQQILYRTVTVTRYHWFKISLTLPLLIRILVTYPDNILREIFILRIEGTSTFFVTLAKVDQPDPFLSEGNSSSGIFKDALSTWTATLRAGKIVEMDKITTLLSRILSVDGYQPIASKIAKILTKPFTETETFFVWNQDRSDWIPDIDPPSYQEATRRQ